MLLEFGSKAKRNIKDVPKVFEGFKDKMEHNGHANLFSETRVKHIRCISRSRWS